MSQKACRQRLLHNFGLKKDGFYSIKALGENKGYDLLEKLLFQRSGIFVGLAIRSFSYKIRKDNFEPEVRLSESSRKISAKNGLASLKIRRSGVFLIIV